MKTPFLKKLFIKGTIETLTGLHISSFNDKYSIGIIDYVMLRDPVTHQPFIPGSSIKGKIRSLLETCIPEGQLSQPSLTEQLFGMPAKQSSAQPARAIFRDSRLTEESASVSMPFADLPFAEIKKEAYIDRTTGKAQPTLIERVPAGLFFDLEIILSIYENDPEQDFLQTIFQGLVLLQDDYLGGRGSRGYGSVKIHLTSIKVKDKNCYLSNLTAPDYTLLKIPDSLL
ncbi:MAG: type III-A CRISPR-associated RAMP protein Csm3 [Candidatus Auribacterota bacterium]|jgi:CRISPR-associated protein Csm3|nr:type III-A CRISPR-associated RAMP protein Csm3 [Candidatus Auribacterota bacterium]